MYINHIFLIKMSENKKKKKVEKLYVELHPDSLNDSDELECLDMCFL